MKPADRSYTIPSNLIVPSQITAWWTYNRPNEEYHILKRNCATVVRDALVAGLKNQVHVSFLKVLSWKGYFTPININTFCTIVEKNVYILWVLAVVLILILIGLASNTSIELIYVLAGNLSFSQFICMRLKMILRITSFLIYFDFFV